MGPVQALTITGAKPLQMKGTITVQWCFSSRGRGDRSTWR
jgi:hypothetical protein